MSVGSPATASSRNAEAIDVQLIQTDRDGSETLVGSYQLRPGASVDVSVSPRTGHDGQIRFKVLRGNVPVTTKGTTRTLKAGQRTTMSIERKSSDRH
jgi:hypothetical protein